MMDNRKSSISVYWKNILLINWLGRVGRMGSDPLKEFARAGIQLGNQNTFTSLSWFLILSLCEL